MSINENAFILHYDKDFTPGSSELLLDTIIPYRYQVEKEGGWFYAVGLLLTMLFGVISSIVALYLTVVVPFTFERSSQETTGHVVNCEMQGRKIGAVPVITYAYTWDNREYTGSSDIVGAEMGDCGKYQDQTLEIVVMTTNPSQSYLAISQTSYAGLQRICLIGGFSFIGAASIYFLYTVLYTFFAYWRARKIYPRLQNGTLLEGKIVRSSGSMGYKSLRFIITIAYTFETPDKRQLKGWSEVAWGKMLSPVPEVGTPVAILYADDHAYMAL